MVVTVEGDGGARPVEVLGHRHPCRKDLVALPLALPRGELRRGPTVDHVAVVDGRETFVFLVAPLVVAFVSPLVIFFQPQAIEISFQHTTVFELVIRPSLMIRVGLFENLVEDGTLWGPSRLFALHSGDEVIVCSLPLKWSCLLPFLSFLRPSAGALVIIHWFLIFASFVAEEGTNRFLARSIVCQYVH